MSLIETCRINGVSEWDYLVWAVTHSREVRAKPEQCLPWNYQGEALKQQIA